MASPVSRDEFSGAAVANLGEIGHLPGVGFADVAGVDDEQSVSMHTTRCLQRHMSIDIPIEPRLRQVSGKPLDGLLQRNGLAEGSTDAAEFDVPGGLDAVDHLLDKAEFGLREKRGATLGERMDLGSQTMNQCGKVHFGWFVLLYERCFVEFTLAEMSRPFLPFPSCAFPPSPRIGKLLIPPDLTSPPGG